MSGFSPIVLLALAGILSGGAYSLHRQGARRGIVGVVGLLALVCAAAGVRWLLPER